MIGRDDKNANGQELAPSMRSKMGILRFWDSRLSMSSMPKYRGLSQAFGILATSN
jgi:hypothetical protein